MLRNYLKIAVRVLAHNKLYTLINVLGLSLGICGCIIIWLISSYELSFDRFHPDGDRIFRIGSKINFFNWLDSDIPPPMPEAIRKEVPGLETVTAFFPFEGNPKITIPKGRETAASFDSHVAGTDLPGVMIADDSWFSIFPYEWLAGNPGIALQQPFTVVLTESRARQYFGSLPPASMIGKQVIYQDSLRVYVAGIVKDWREHTDFPYTDFISFPTIAGSFLKNSRHLDDWSLRKGGGTYDWPSCFIKLAKGVAPAKVEGQLRLLAARHMKTDSLSALQVQLQSLGDIHFNNDYSHDDIRKAHLPTLYALMGIALFILSLAAVNFINLSTAQSLQRAKEIGVRKVLGSGRVQLMRQFLLETGMLAALATVLAALLVIPVLSFFRDYIPPGVQFRPFAPSTLLFLVSVILLTTLLAGFYPARVLAGYLPAQTLKGSGSWKGDEKWWLRKGLIVFQFTISLVFIIVTMVIGDQIRFMLHTDYGLKTDAIMTVSTDGEDTMGKITVLAQRFRQLPGIEQIVREGMVPTGWAMMYGGVTYKDKNVREQQVILDIGDENFVPFYQMRIVAGRNLRHSDSLTEWVINETMATSLGFARPEQALGKMLYLNNRARPIVGVVADFHLQSFRDVIKPVVIGHLPMIEQTLGIKLAAPGTIGAGTTAEGSNAGHVEATLSAMEKIYKELYPGSPFEYRFLDESIANMYKSEQKTAALVRVAMGLAILISCMGLFGLSLFTAERRAREIGIRKVLGATAADIAGLLSKDFVLLVLLALVIASPVALMVAHRWLQEFAYRVSVTWGVFILAGLGAVTIALITVSWQSVRAALANPVQSLKRE
jgi:putative ABC transport system permease protein